MSEVLDTRRWAELASAALLAAGLGAAIGQSVVFLAAVVPVVLLAYGRLGETPTVDLAVDRALDPEHPRPGERVDVTVTVRNDGDSTLPDLRVVDGVPDALGVVEGSPRMGTVLRPGNEASFTYTVVAKRGQHAFEHLTAYASGANGTQVREKSVPVETELRCEVPIDDLPLSGGTTRTVGRVTADAGGSGVEFHTTREYQPSDPMNRVDWRRLARTGELSTVDFREDRAATVQLLVDARPPARQRAEEGEPNAVEYAAYAAERTFNTLLSGGNRVGIGILPDDVNALVPGAGETHRSRGRRLFAEHEQFERARDGAAPDTDENGVPDDLLARLPASAQVVWFSPLLDDASVELVRRMAAAGHSVTVVSPSLSRTDTIGGELATRHREERQRQLREARVPVVDWDPKRPLALAIDQAVTGGVFR